MYEILCGLLIFMGTICYTIASYYHLKIKEWTFLKALMIAVPFVLIEYTFTLHAHRLAFEHLNASPSKILIFTICCNFICIWVFNYYVMEIKLNVRDAFREFISFLLIVMAFYISNVIR